MNAFSAGYCKSNPSVFSSPDTAYVLSFSLIMLNTDLHNPAIKRKISKEAFIKNNRGIDSGNDLPAELLTKLYESFLAQELEVVDGGTDYNSIAYTLCGASKSGYLLKRGRLGTSSSRFFTVARSCLYYFKTDTDTAPLGLIPLEGLQVRVESDARGAKNAFYFELFSPNDAQRYVKGVKFDPTGATPPEPAEHQTYFLAAPTVEERNEWVKVLRAQMTGSMLMGQLPPPAGSAVPPVEIDTALLANRATLMLREQTRSTMSLAPSTSEHIPLGPLG
jgi:hypothetical protein